MPRLGRRRLILLALGVLASLVLVTAVGVEYLQNRTLETKLASNTTSQAGAISDLAAAKQQIQTLQAQNSGLSDRVASLNSQVASLNNQIASLKTQVTSLQAQVPPPPYPCTEDPGVRANVNQISLQTVGESTTQ